MYKLRVKEAAVVSLVTIIIDKRMERDWKRSAHGKKRRVAFSLT